MIDPVELLGFFSAFCTTIAYWPQVRKTWRTRSARDLSLPMFLILNVGLFGWLSYGILTVTWPIILANAVTILFTMSILYCKLKYG